MVGFIFLFHWYEKYFLPIICKFIFRTYILNRMIFSIKFNDNQKKVTIVKVNI